MCSYVQAQFSKVLFDSPRPFWQSRYYDFNVHSDRKRHEKLDYMHYNPVKRELVDKPDNWPWSSYNFYQTGKTGGVQITRFEEGTDPP